LKKCYFGNYRFSEDLGFTVLEEVHINVDFLSSAFSDISSWIYEYSGVDIPNTKIAFEI